MRRILCFGAAIAVAAVIALATAAPAHADTITVTISGTASGTDSTFGGNAVDAPFVATMVFNTSVGILNTSSTYNYLVGGTYYSAPTPSIQDSLSLNGDTTQWQATYLSQLEGENIPGVEGNFGDQAIGTNDSLILNVQGNNAYIPADVFSPFSVNLTDSEFAGLANYSSFSDAGGSLQLTPTAISETVDPVPEPATWAMILVGLGVLGTIHFNRRKGASTLDAAETN